MEHLPRRVQAVALAVHRDDDKTRFMRDVPESLHILALTTIAPKTGRGGGTLSPPQTLDSSIGYAEGLVGNLRPERRTTDRAKERLHDRIKVEVRKLRRHAQRLRELG